MIRGFWFILGIIALGFGMAGVPLPLLPTVPFLLLAAFCFAKSSPRLHAWLLEHKIFGPMIKDWQSSGRIRRRAKYMATLTIALAFGLSLIMGLPLRILVIQAAVLSCVMAFIWTRPD